MTLTSPAAVVELLRRRGLRAQRRFGQSFLIDANILRRVVEAADLTPETGVLEVGPGLGVLTRALAERCRRVLAVELDQGFCAALREETLAGLDNVELLPTDFLDLELPAVLSEALGPGPHTVVSNLPYSITTPALARFLEHREWFSHLVLMVQREVADRLQAGPGSRTYGALSVLAQFHADLRRITVVPRRAFFPVPEVESALLRFDLRTAPRFPDVDPERYFHLVHGVFQQRRKTLLNSVGAVYPELDRAAVHELLGTAGIDPTRRPETLSLEEFAALLHVQLPHATP